MADRRIQSGGCPWIWLLRIASVRYATHGASIRESMQRVGGGRRADSPVASKRPATARARSCGNMSCAMPGRSHGRCGMIRTRRDFMLVVAGAAATVLIAAAIGLIVLYSGAYSVAATGQHTAPVYSILEIGMHRSVRARLADIRAPEL